MYIFFEGPRPESVLTRREFEVYILLGHGKSNTEIASALIITEDTVRSHISNICDKLQMTRVQVAIRSGIEQIWPAAQVTAA